MPQPAVGRNPKGEPTVLVVDDQNMARLKLIKTGRAVNGDWQVLQGLKAGDKVIVQGLQGIRPDTKVKPVPAKSATPAKPGTK